MYLPASSRFLTHVIFTSFVKGTGCLHDGIWLVASFVWFDWFVGAAGWGRGGEVTRGGDVVRGGDVERGGGEVLGLGVGMGVGGVLM